MTLDTPLNRMKRGFFLDNLGLFHAGPAGDELRRSPARGGERLGQLLVSPLSPLACAR